MVKVKKSDSCYHKISSSAWTRFHRQLPKADVCHYYSYSSIVLCLISRQELSLPYKVSFEFDRVVSFLEISSVLVPDLPLLSLHITSNYEEEDDWRVSDTLTHLATHFSKSLREQQLSPWQLLPLYLSTYASINCWNSTFLL